MKLFEDISLREQQKLLESMVTIENILTKQHNENESVITIRNHYTDDDKEIMIEKQREFYTDIHGFDEKF